MAPPPTSTLSPPANPAASITDGRYGRKILLPVDVVVASAGQFAYVVASERLPGKVLPQGTDSLTALVHHCSEIVPSSSGRDGGASYGGGGTPAATGPRGGGAPPRARGKKR